MTIEDNTHRNKMQRKLEENNMPCSLNELMFSKLKHKAVQQFGCKIIKIAARTEQKEFSTQKTNILKHRPNYLILQNEFNR